MIISPFLLLAPRFFEFLAGCHSGDTVELPPGCSLALVLKGKSAVMLFAKDAVDGGWRW